MDGEPVEPGSQAAPEVDNEALIAELDGLWQKRTQRRGTLQNDLQKTKEPLEKLESGAAEKQEVEAKVTSTVRRASVIVDPQRVEASIAEIGEVQISSDEAAKVVNETWTKRLNRMSSLIGDIGSTKDIITQLTNSTSTEVEEKFASVQALLAKMEACDESEQEAIQQIQEMWACQDVKSPTFQEDLEM